MLFRSGMLVEVGARAFGSGQRRDDFLGRAVHDRFGRIVFVQVDPYSGAFIREVML